MGIAVRPRLLLFSKLVLFVTHFSKLVLFVTSVFVFHEENRIEAGCICSKKLEGVVYFEHALR